MHHKHFFVLLHTVNTLLLSHEQKLASQQIALHFDQQKCLSSFAPKHITSSKMLNLYLGAVWSTSWLISQDQNVAGIGMTAVGKFVTDSK